MPPNSMCNITKTQIDPCTSIIALFVWNRDMKTPLITEGMKSASPSRNRFTYLSPGKYFNINDNMYMLKTLNMNTKMMMPMLIKNWYLVKSSLNSPFLLFSSSISFNFCSSLTASSTCRLASSSKTTFLYLIPLTCAITDNHSRVSSYFFWE